MNVEETQKRVYKDAVDQGWFTGELNVGERLMRIVMEVAEAGEDSRRGGDLTAIRLDPSGKPEGFPVELADVVIATLELAEACGVDLTVALEAKMAYNRSRPRRSGGKEW